MKKRADHKCHSFTRTVSVFMLLTLLISLVSLAGCGSGNSSDAELDRVPDVPAATRSSKGATVPDPRGR